MQRSSTQLAPVVLLALACTLDAQTSYAPRRTMLPVFPEVDRAAFGDLDGDGDLDAFTSSNVNAGLLLNDGTGRLEARAGAFPPSSTAYGTLQLADLDGDGDLDAASSFDLYRNEGDGTFGPCAGPVLGGIQRIDLAIGDVDGDGDLDLAVGTGSFGPNPRTRLLLFNGTDYDDASNRLPVDAVSTRFLVFADVDGDGDLDLLLGNSEPVTGPEDASNRLYRNDGTGIFTDSSQDLPGDLDETLYLEPFDADGDGDLDLFVGNDGPDRLWINDGAGVFVELVGALPPQDERTLGVAVGDLDGDGDLDLVRRNEVLVNDGAGVFAVSQVLPVRAFPGRVAALGDVDGDGDLDVLLAPGLFLNDGSGGLLDVASALAFDVDAANAVRWADLDGDGDLDAVLASWPQLGISGHNRVLWNDGSAGFTEAAAPLPGGAESTRAVLVADLDGDGDADLVFGNRFEPSRLLLNGGAGSFTDAPMPLPATATATTALAAADVEGDGDLDLFFGRGEGSTPFNVPGYQDGLLLNDGAAGFTYDASRLPLDTFNTGAAAFGDLDGDGDADLLVGYDNRRPQLHRNDGGGTFVADDPLASFPGLTGEQVVGDLALGDLDLDGDLDGFLAGSANLFSAGPPPSLLWNDGAGQFSLGPGTDPFFDRGFRTVALADLDGDGDLDVFTDNFAFRNDLGGAFVELEGAFEGVSNLFDLDVADADGDGDLDLLTSLPGARRVLYGLDRQLTWGNLPRVGRPLTLELDGPPFGGWALASSPITGDVDVPPFGTLLLEPTLLGYLGEGLLDADGHGAFTGPVPADPSLVGVDYFFQAAVGPPFRFTNRERATFLDL